MRLSLTHFITIQFNTVRCWVRRYKKALTSKSIFRSMLAQRIIVAYFAKPISRNQKIAYH